MKKYYLVYKTTNLVNGKIYIGKHETDNLDDGYLGSGNLLRRAIKKYGEENFKREILFECSTIEEMNAKEAELVNEEFLKRDDVYNIKLGGNGGFDYINETHRNTVGIAEVNANGENNKSGQCYTTRNRIKQDKDYALWFSNRIKDGQQLSDYEFGSSFRGKHHTEEAKAKMREKARLRVGEKNSAFGSIWIYNKSLEQNKKVKKEQVETFLNQGWKLGRKMNFHK